VFLSAFGNVGGTRSLNFAGSFTFRAARRIMSPINEAPASPTFSPTTSVFHSEPFASSESMSLIPPLSDGEAHRLFKCFLAR